MNASTLTLVRFVRLNLLYFKSVLPFLASDFGLVFNQTSYAVVTNLTLALTGAPLVKFTIYFSDSITSSAAILGWTVNLLNIGGVSNQYFTFEEQQTHPFPVSFQTPLADSDSIVVFAATGPNAPTTGIYSYILQVTVVTGVLPNNVQAVTDLAVVNITLTGEILYLYSM